MSKIKIVKTSSGAGTSRVPGSGIELIPLEPIVAIGKIFQEGTKYGRDNWRKSAWDVEWIYDRESHAQRHRIIQIAPHLCEHLIGDDEDVDTADHFAKYIWWQCVLFAFRDDPEFAGSPGQYFAVHGHLRGYKAP